MPIPHPVCHDCQLPMDQGFIPDLAHGAVMQSRWIGGTPEAPTFLGVKWAGEVKPEQFRHGLRVWTYRCPQCGKLEQYAFVEDEN